jgi:hypothetical protein
LSRAWSPSAGFGFATPLVMAALLAVGACTPPAPRLHSLDPPTQDAQSADPALATDPATGDVLLSWVAGDSAGWHLYFARSPDGGTGWSAPVRVSDREHDVHPHGESSPRLVAAPGVVALVWINSVPAPGRRWPGSNVRFSRSADGGRTWSPALTLNDDTASATPRGHIFHGAAWRGDSGLVVAWMDERGGAAPGNTDVEDHGSHHPEAMEEPDATIYVAESGDLGRTWRTNRPFRGAACPCCRVSLARRSGGTVFAAWRKHFAGNVRDVVVAPLDGDPEETRVHEDGWVYPGCPHTGPGLAIDTANGGLAHVTWYNGKPGTVGVYYAWAAISDMEFGAPLPLVAARTLPAAHPRVAALANGGALAAWDVGADGQAGLHVARIAPNGRASRPAHLAGSAGADHPEVLALTDGIALVAWTEQRNGERRLRLARVPLTPSP